MASSRATLEAKRREEYRKKQMEKKQEKERLEKLKLDYVQRGFNRMERQSLGGVIRSLLDSGGSSSSGTAGDTNSSGRLMLEATSVHGQGDKITLPPSLLSTLAARDLLRTSQERGQPLFFRLGIRRPGYVFPAGDKMKQLMDAFKYSLDGSEKNDEMKLDNEGDESMILEDEEGEENENDEEWEEAYQDELSHEYISYCYATVIEFTEEEGYVGLPLCIATALLSPKNKNKSSEQCGLPLQMIESKLTIDPALASTNVQDNDESKNQISRAATEMEQMDIDRDQEEEEEENLESKTPGHPAYGSFPVPMEQIEVSLLTHLPLGKKCTLQPTREAIEKGFYKLKDVKLALEQSLIRTRGCLNVGDVVYCWHRGVKFNLNVKDVSPPRVGAVSCVNTDVEVDIAVADGVNDNGDGKNENTVGSKNDGQKLLGRTLSGGYRLSNDNNTSTTNETVANDTTKQHSDLYSRLNKNVPPEPGIEQKENVIAVQIRGDGGKQCRRRFDSSVSKMEDIFAFVLSEQIIESGVNEFRLVTRFPRRVFTLQEHGNTILEKMDLSKQELFLIEKVV